MPDNVTQLFGMTEHWLRGTIFLGVLLACMVAEAIAPRRPRKLSRTARWRTNGTMVLASNLIVRLIAIAFPLIIATSAASYSELHQIGIFHHVNLPQWIEFVFALLILDFAVWLQHVISHNVPILWRFHKVHHSDRELDASSALRFHPGEIALSAIYKVAVILALGPSVLAVIVFEILLNACAIFNHSNLALSHTSDRIVRAFVVSPDMHRVHHSTHRDEQSKNFGFCLSIWDRALGTYVSQPMDGHARMNLGLSSQQNLKPQKLIWNMIFPFKSQK